MTEKNSSRSLQVVSAEMSGSVMDSQFGGIQNTKLP